MTPHEHAIGIPVMTPSEPYCANCVERLRAAVEALPGVVSADVDRRAATLLVSHDTDVLPDARIEDEVRRLGFEVAAGVAHAGWRVTGLD